MIINSSVWATMNEISAEVVIIGSGAAGTSLAHDLSANKHSVIICEGGKDNYSEQSQECYSGSATNRDLTFGLKGSRLRFFGGSTNCWAGGCGELENEDYIHRDWVSNSGWPIEKSELDSYYKKASNFLDIPREIFNANNNKDINQILGFDTKSLVYTNKVRFKDEYNNLFKKDKNVNLLLEANLFSLNRGIESNKISSVTIKDFSGITKIIKGKVFVLCCGGIENARILLNSENINHGALGNQNDNVGRFFCDHPIAPCATLINENGITEKSALDINRHRRTTKNITVPYYKIPFEVQEKYKILNTVINFQSQENQLSQASLSAFKIKTALSGKSGIKIDKTDYLNVLKDPISVTKAWYKRSNNFKTRIALRFQIEQEPNRNNRITLTNDKDSLGLPKVNLAWDFTDIERRSIDIAMYYTANVLHKNKLGSLMVDDFLIENKKELPYDLRGGQHHSGTTRMSSSESNGVVNRDLLVHGVKNLHVLGGSVFPTNSWVNPTFTIIALSLRLSDHLSSKVLKKI
jgi:choline dehydrogenase-like flavoprotein